MEELRQIIETEFTVSDYYMDVDGTPVFLLPPNQETKVPFQRLIEKLKTYKIMAILRHSSQLKREYNLSPALEAKNEKQMLALKVIPKSVEGKRKGPVWNLAFLIATICTVALAGYFWANQYNPTGILISLISGPLYGWYTDPLLLTIGFTAILLSILGTHELGHYITSKKKGIEASLPFFIPFPPYIFGIPTLGTMGAVIFQRSPSINRDHLFDLGLMGPLTGFIIALFMAVLSIKLSPLIYPNVLYTLYQLEYQLSSVEYNFVINVYNTYSPAIALVLGQYLVSSGSWPVLFIGPSIFPDSLILTFLVSLLRPETAFSSIFLSPLYFAVWVGFAVTALNLAPSGMLDGGHMLRAILSRRAHYIASIIIAIILVTISWIGIPIAAMALISIRRTGHPGALDEVSPLKTSRKIIFIVMMFILVISIPPISWFYL
ncbi:MAG: site-2 protease family protein [Candidatus Freyarchaeum deiterrae]